MNNIWHDISRERITPEDFICVIEISKGSKKKYELDMHDVLKGDYAKPNGITENRLQKAYNAKPSFLKSERWSACRKRSGNSWAFFA